MLLPVLLGTLLSFDGPPLPQGERGAGELPAPAAPASLRRVPLTQYPDFQDDLDRDSLGKASAEAAGYLKKLPPDRKLVFGQDAYPVRQIQKSLARFDELLRGSRNLNRAIRKEFILYQSLGNDGAGSVVFTGYVDADIPAETAPTPDFPFPIYKRPPDLARTTPSPDFPYDYGRLLPNGSLAPYFSREEIQNGALQSQSLEIFWAQTLPDVFFLQIQGSGWLTAPDGGKTRVVFDGANGLPYASVGQYLIAHGELTPEEATSLGVIRYLKKQPPARQIQLLNIDPRYVFFKTSAADIGPLTATETRLIPGRSIAVDASQIPLGALGFIISERPIADDSGTVIGKTNFSRFVLCQDTGAAIQGPGRADIFWGAGRKAEGEAGAMRAPGNLYLLVLRN